MLTEICSAFQQRLYGGSLCRQESTEQGLLNSNFYKSICQRITKVLRGVLFSPLYSEGLFKWKWIGNVADCTGFLDQKMLIAMATKANKQIKRTKDNCVTCLKIILPNKFNDQLRSSCQLTPGTCFSKMQFC